MYGFVLIFVGIYKVSEKSAQNLSIPDPTEKNKPEQTIGNGTTSAGKKKITSLPQLGCLWINGAAV